MTIEDEQNIKTKNFANTFCNTLDEVKKLKF